MSDEKTMKPGIRARTVDSGSVFDRYDIDLDKAFTCQKCGAAALERVCPDCNNEAGLEGLHCPYCNERLRSHDNMMWACHGCLAHYRLALCQAVHVETSKRPNVETPVETSQPANLEGLFRFRAVRQGDRYVREPGDVRANRVMVPRILQAPAGPIRVEAGDWFVVNEDGEGRPCNDLSFREVYEPVDREAHVLWER